MRQEEKLDNGKQVLAYWQVMVGAENRIALVASLASFILLLASCRRCQF